MQSLGKIVTFGQKLKLSKACKQQHYKHITVNFCKKPLKKTPDIQKMKHFHNAQNWPPCKGYSLCKTVTLGQNARILGVFSSGVLHTTTLLWSYNRFSYLFNIFNF